MNDDQFIVICRGDREFMSRRKAPYVLATRRVFSTQVEATIYAKTVAKSRQPLVVAGRFAQLRFELKNWSVVET